MATKKQHADFNRSVSKYLESIGAETKDNAVFHGQWVLKTVAGELVICVREPERSEVFSIFCQFESPNKGAEILDEFAKTHFNKYSGKWNFHSYDAGELLVEFKNEISVLLPVIA